MKGFEDKHFPKCRGVNLPGAVYLYPGEYHFATEPTMIHTVLGSCVSVTLFDRITQSGVMCHAVLDSDQYQNDPAQCSRYMDCVIDEMFSIFAEYGINVENLEAKMFGGAQMLVQGKASPTSRPGMKNILMARKVLQEYDCKIVGEDCGGLQGRKIYFCSHTGDVFLKKIKKVVDLRL